MHAGLNEHGQWHTMLHNAVAPYIWRRLPPPLGKAMESFPRFVASVCGLTRRQSAESFALSIAVIKIGELSNEIEIRLQHHLSTLVASTPYLMSLLCLHLHSQQPFIL